MKSNTYSYLNNTREKIIMQGHANLEEIKAFIPCGYKNARKIQQEIIKEALDSGRSVITNGKSMLIKPSHLLKHIGLTEKEIHYYAEIERKKAANGN